MDSNIHNYRNNTLSKSSGFGEPVNNNEPSTAKDWIYPLKEVLFVSSELPNGITDIELVNIFPNEA
jgi:hypothetical protein